MNRTTRASLACLSLLTPIASSILHAQPATPQRPNVIFIYVDDMGRGMLSAYGQKHLTTPNIDRLVNQGTSFSNAYGCMVSAASRASMLTGYHDCRHASNNKWRVSSSGQYVSLYNSATNKVNEAGLTSIEQNIDANDIKLGTGDYYLPQVFKQAGYVTAEIGKCEWGWTATRKQMTNHGWDYYYGYLDHVRCHGFYPPFLFDNGKMVQIEGNTFANCAKTQENETDATYAARHNMKGKKVYAPTLFEEKLKEFIRNHKDEAFFLFHPTTLPHGPVMIPEVNDEVANDPLLTQIEKEYASMVKLIDDQVGMLVEEVRKAGLEDRTLFVFSSDNGHEIYYSKPGRINKSYSDQSGRHFDNVAYKYRADLAGDIFRGTEDLAGLKRTNLEGGFRVPLIICGPGVPHGQECTDIVANYDLLPTFADMLNVKLSVAKSGVSIWPVITKGKHLPADRRIYFSSYNGMGGGAAMIQNDGWKIRRTSSGVSELYQIRLDPTEQKDLGPTYPEKRAELEKVFLKAIGNNWTNGNCGY